MNAVSLSANFEQNLAAIAQYLQAEELNAVNLAAAALNVTELTTVAKIPAYLQLLELLSTKVIANLSQFPEIGRKYLERQPQSVEAIALLTEIEKLCPPDEVREYLLNDYLVLYINRSHTTYLLAIRHQRQLAFEYMQNTI
jgi:hypothetical protein